MADKTQHPGHYAKCAIEPAEFINRNRLRYAEGNVIKYAVRHDLKGGLADVVKAMRYLQMIAAEHYGTSVTFTVEQTSRPGEANMPMQGDCVDTHGDCWALGANPMRSPWDGHSPRCFRCGATEGNPCELPT